MMNRRELEKMLQHLKAEYMEALERGNERIQNNIVNQILNLEVTLKEDEFKNNMKEVKVDDEVDFVFDETEAFRQKVIVKSFSNKLKELCKNITNYQVIESNEEFKEKALASKERLAEKRLAGKSSGNNTPGQITQNNTYIFNPKEQYEVMKNLDIPAAKVEQPDFDLS